MAANCDRVGASFSFLNYVVREQLRNINPDSVVDFGAGSGKNCNIARDVCGKSCHITAVEGYKFAVEKLLESQVCDVVCNELIETWLKRIERTYDVAIFGDVLEHLTYYSIRKVLAQCKEYFRSLLSKIAF